MYIATFSWEVLNQTTLIIVQGSYSDKKYKHDDKTVSRSTNTIKLCSKCKGSKAIKIILSTTHSKVFIFFNASWSEKLQDNCCNCCIKLSFTFIDDKRCQVTVFSTKISLSNRIQTDFYKKLHFGLRIKGKVNRSELWGLMISPWSWASREQLHG